MTAGPSIEPARFLHEQLTHASPDLLRELLATFIDALMGAEADAICGAEYGTRTPERANTRNGYRDRDFDARVGTMDVAIPKLRAGTYFPDWLLERRRRAEAALTRVVATCYLLGGGVGVRGFKRRPGRRSAWSARGQRASRNAVTTRTTRMYFRRSARRRRTKIELLKRVSARPIAVPLRFGL